MTILARYLTTRVVIHFLVVVAVFTTVFVAYSLAVSLSRAAAGLLRPEFVLRIVLMKAVIAADVILPVALYAAVALAMARLRRSGETTGMLTGGFGPGNAGIALTPLFLLVAVAVGAVSLWLRPATYAEVYQLRVRAESAFDLTGLEGGRFYPDADGNRVVWVESVEGRRLRRVFIWNRQDDRKALVIHADDILRLDSEEGRATLAVGGIHVYKQDRDEWSLVGEAGSLTTGVDFGGVAPVGYKRKAATTWELAGSGAAEDVAELQWRLSRPLSALLLGFLALRTAGMVVRFRGAFAGSVLVIAGGLVYELATLTARNWVKDGDVGAWPGLWWVHGAMVLLLLLPRRAPGRGARSRPDAVVA